MDKKDTALTGNYLVPTLGQAIARRSDSLVVRGLRELDGAEQKSRCSPDVFQRLDKLYLSYGRGIAIDDRAGVWKAGDSFTEFTGDFSTELRVFDFCLLGNDDLNFWKGIGDPAGLTQEKLRAALLEYRSRLQDPDKWPEGVYEDEGKWPGSVFEVTPPSESQIMVWFDGCPGGLAIWSEPEGAHVEIDGSFVGNTALNSEGTLVTEITTGEHLVVVRKTGYETWSQKLQVSRLTPGTLPHISEMTTGSGR
jgi:hypothetical protein